MGKYILTNFVSASDLDSIRALFNEKEKELSLAVAKVEELTRQLEELRRGRSSRDPPPASALELDKLRRELMVGHIYNHQQAFKKRLYAVMLLAYTFIRTSCINKLISNLKFETLK